MMYWRFHRFPLRSAQRGCVVTATAYLRFPFRSVVFSRFPRSSTDR
jgi:hypothetical protein